MKTRILGGIILIWAAPLFAQNQTEIFHVVGDRDHYHGVTGGKKVEIVTKDCLHKAEDEKAIYTTLDGKPYQIYFNPTVSSDSCSVVSFKEVK